MRNQYQTVIVELTIPADQSMLLVVRLTTAGVLARSAIGVDKLDDAKMAVEEACSCLMDQLSATGRIYLSFSRGRHHLTVSARSADRCPEMEDEQTADPQELDVVKCLLETLVDEVDLNVCGKWIREIRMRLALAD